MSCSLQATRDMHKCGLVLSTSNSQFKAAHALNCVSCFLLKQVCMICVTVFYTVMLCKVALMSCHMTSNE